MKLRLDAPQHAPLLKLPRVDAWRRRVDVYQRYRAAPHKSRVLTRNLMPVCHDGGDLATLVHVDALVGVSQRYHCLELVLQRRSQPVCQETRIRD